MPRVSKPKAKPTHAKGQHLGVALIDPVSGLLLPSYHAKDGSRVYVQAMNGQTYGIQVENYTGDWCTYEVLIDGLTVIHKVIMPNQTVNHTTACTGIEELPDGTTRETYRPLMFSNATLVPSWKPSDAHLAEKSTVQQQLDKLGKVTVKVRRAIKTEQRGVPIKIVVGEEKMSVEVSKDIDRKILKNAAFAVHTALAADEKVLVMSQPRAFCNLGEHLETLTLSYGTEAALRKELPGVMIRKKRGWMEVYGYDPNEVAKKPAKQSGGTGNKGKKKGRGARRTATVEIDDEDEKPEPEMLHWDFTRP